MRQADQALIPPMVRLVRTPRRAGVRNPVRSRKFKIVLSERPVLRRLAPYPCPALTALSDRVDVPGVRAGNDVTAADVAFAVVRRVSKLACAVPESRVRARLAALRQALASS